MARDCVVCQGQGRLAVRLHKEGKTLAEIREAIDAALAAEKVAVRVTLAFDNIETIKRAIEIGSGVSLLPEPTVAREIAAGTLVQIPIEGIELARPLGIIYRRDRKLSDTAHQFIQLLQSQAAPIAEVEVPMLVGSAESNGHPANESLATSNVAS